MSTKTIVLGATVGYNGASLGIGNHIKVDYIPFGLSVYISTKRTPLDEEKFLIDDVFELLKSPDIFANATELFISTSGTSNEEIKLLLSNITIDSSYISLIRKEAESLDNSFRPKSQNEEIITNGSTFNLDTTAINSIRFDSLQEIEISINNSGFFYPMLEDLIHLDYISSLDFKNSSGTDTTLKYLLG